jgi:hypothetical protein
MARLLSVNVGLPREVAWNGQTVRTAVWKLPIRERRMVRKLNIDGDGQGDLAGHGGEHRAVFVYQMGSYHYWEHFLSRNDFTYGQFGENFTIDGLLDNEVCIGDRYRIGDGLFEVTQPRVTCYRVGIRMKARLGRAMKSQKSAMVQSASRSRTRTLFCICQDTLASSWNAPSRSQLSAQAGRLLSAPSFSRSRMGKPPTVIPASPARSSLQHGPVSSRCGSGAFVRKATASPPSL